MHRLFKGKGAQRTITGDAPMSGCHKMVRCFALDQVEVIQQRHYCTGHAGLGYATHG